MSGTLYIVATPIGNLEDITLRAIRILSDVDIILAEDTRVTKKLLDMVFSRRSLAVGEEENKSSDQRPVTKDQRLISYHQHSSEEKKLEILNYLLDGKDIALVTDAGTPGISDPGNELIDYLLSYQPDLKVLPISGASAITTALSVSGFRSDKFQFIGFWPKKKVNKLIQTLKLTKQTFVFYESPYRILKTLDLLKEHFGGDLRVFIGRELTKLHETLYRGTVKEVREKLEEEKVKGEIVVVVEL